MDSVPVIPQRPKRSKDSAERAADIPERSTPEVTAIESKHVASDARPTLSTPPIPSRPKKKTAVSTDPTDEFNTVTDSKKSEPSFARKDISVPDQQVDDVSPPVTPTDIISGYESDPEDNKLENLEDESGKATFSNVEKKKSNETPRSIRESERVDSGTSSDEVTTAGFVSEPSKDYNEFNSEETAKVCNKPEDNYSVPSPIELPKDTKDTESPSGQVRSVGPEENELKEKIPPIPVRPRLSKLAHSEVDLSKENIKSLPLEQNESDFTKSGNEDDDPVILESPNPTPLGGQFKLPSAHSSSTNLLSTQSKEKSNAVEASDTAFDTPEQKEVSEPVKQSPSIPVRPQPTIPTRPTRKKEAPTESRQSGEESSIGSNFQSSDVSSTAVTPNSEPTETNTRTGTKKAPPPKPKKLSSKIAAFQQMFNQEPPQKPTLAKKPSEERSKLSSDRSDFAASLSSMMGRGVALPGMANPELMKKLSASENAEDEAESAKQNAATPSTPVAPTRRARGPRGKRLPKSIQESQVEVKSRFTIHSANLWEVDIKRTDLTKEAEESSSDETFGVTDDFKDSVEEQPATKFEAVQDSNVTEDSAVSEAAKDDLPVSIDSLPKVVCDSETDEESRLQEVQLSNASKQSPNELDVNEDTGDSPAGDKVTKTFVIPNAVPDAHELVGTPVAEEQSLSSLSNNNEKTEALRDISHLESEHDDHI